MKKVLLMRILLGVVSTAILIGAALAVHFLIPRGDEDLIKVNNKDGETKVITFEALSLRPDTGCEYYIAFEGESRKHEAELTFRETDEGLLENFVRVRVEADGIALYDRLLAELFKSEEALRVDVNSLEEKELRIIYYLPYDVGNGAQSAETFFELWITSGGKE